MSNLNIEFIDEPIRKPAGIPVRPRRYGKTWYLSIPAWIMQMYNLKENQIYEVTVINRHKNYKFVLGRTMIKKVIPGPNYHILIPKLDAELHDIEENDLFEVTFVKKLKYQKFVSDKYGVGGQSD